MKETMRKRNEMFRRLLVAAVDCAVVCALCMVGVMSLFGLFFGLDY